MNIDRLDAIIDADTLGCLCDGCPGSNSPVSCNLHQTEFEIFCRGEDEEKGICVVVNSLGMITQTYDKMKNNPSSRRQGARIKFWCEQKEQWFYLNIEQHKGNTNAYWTKGVERKEDELEGA